MQGAAQNITKQLITSLEPDNARAGEALLLYMQRLDDHRKMCELSGRCVLHESGSNRSHTMDQQQSLPLHGAQMMICVCRTAEHATIHKVMQDVAAR